MHALDGATGSPGIYVGQSLAYAVAYAVALLVIASALFERRDLA
jgi:ABC-type transport system involved in multi-copper enzyme maturation permease subunit